MEQGSGLTITQDMVSSPHTVSTGSEEVYHAHIYCSTDLSAATLQSHGSGCRDLGSAVGGLYRSVYILFCAHRSASLGLSLFAGLGERPPAQVDRADGAGPRLPDSWHARLHWRK